MSRIIELNSGAANTSEAHEEPDTVVIQLRMQAQAAVRQVQQERRAAAVARIGCVAGAWCTVSWECSCWYSILSTSLCYLAVWAVGPTCYPTTTRVDIAALRSVDGDEDRPTCRKKRGTRTTKLWDPTLKVDVDVAAENARIEQEMTKLQQSYADKEKQVAERSSRALKQEKATAAKRTSSAVTKASL